MGDLVWFLGDGDFEVRFLIDFHDEVIEVSGHIVDVLRSEFRTLDDYIYHTSALVLDWR